jgi:hypothetical protein
VTQSIGNCAKRDPQVDQTISDLVGSLTDPIICHRGQEEQPPEWLRNPIVLERMIMNLTAQKGEIPTGTDAEAAWYLSTASLEFPFDEQWTRIYCYEFTQVYEKWRKSESVSSVPGDIKVDKLDEYDMGQLRRLKDWIYATRIRARRDRDRSERRERKEQDKRGKAELQPRMFNF